jgi:hypothetical protein
MNVNERESETADDAAPFDLGALKIDKQRRGEARSLQVIQALRKMLLREPLDALALDHESFLDHDVREVFTDTAALVHHGVGNLALYRKTTRHQLTDHGALIDLFQKPAPQRIRDFISSPDRDLNQFTFIQFINGL